MTYTFFFSYARQDFSPYLHKFFKDLYEEIRIRKGDSSQICFFDQKAIRLGESWNEKLLEAAQGSKVLVPLYSPAYFKSHYCGLEWQTFRLKEDLWRVSSDDDFTPSIIKPVIWYPPETLPKAVTKFQYTIGTQSDLHNKLGLYEICKQSSGRYKAPYHDFLRVFADEMMATLRALKDRPQPSAVPLSASDITNPFLEESTLTPRHGSRLLGPKFVYFFVVAQNIEWRPFQPPEPSPIGPIAQRVAADPRLNYNSSLVPCGLEYELVKEIREAEASRNIVILLIDGLNAESYRQQLAHLDMQNFFNCSIFVPWNKADPMIEARLEELKKIVRARLERWATTKHSIYFHDEIYSVTQMSDELRETLIRLEANIVNTAAVSPGRHLTGGVAPRIENA